ENHITGASTVTSGSNHTLYAKWIEVGSVDNYITFDGTNYDVDGAGDYATLKAAVDACADKASDGIIIQFGSTETPLVVTTTSSGDTTTNALNKTATYKGSVELSGFSDNPNGLIIPTGVTATFKDLDVRNAAYAEAVYPDYTNTYTTIYVKGTLNVDDGTAITGNIGGSTRGNAVTVASTGTLVVNGGSIDAHTTELNPINTGSYANAISNSGTVTVNGGTISTDSYRHLSGNYSAAIHQLGAGTVTANGGTITGVMSGIYNGMPGGEVITINNGIVEATGSGAAVRIYYGTGNINGGIVRATSTTGYANGVMINTNGGILNASGGTISAASTTNGSAAIYIGGSSTVNVLDTAAITSPIAGIYGAWGNGAVLNMSGGTIAATGSNAYGLKAAGNLTLNMTGGTISATNNTAVTNYGIYMTSCSEANPSEFNISGGTVSQSGTGYDSAAIYFATNYSTANISGTAQIESAVDNTLKLANCDVSDSSAMNVFGKTIYSHNNADIAIGGAAVDNIKKISSGNYGNAVVSAINFDNGKEFAAWTSDSVRNVTKGGTNSAALSTITTEGATTIYLKVQDAEVLSSEAYVTSDIYTVNDEEETISNVPAGTDVDDFVNNLTPADGATIGVYGYNGNWSIREGAVQEGDWVYVLSENEEYEMYYEVHLTAVEAPAAPTGVVASASSGKVTVSWNAVEGAEGYKVYMSTTSGSYGDPLETVAANVYSYSAEGLTNGVTYFFVVKSNSAQGVSGYSNEVSGTPHSSGGGSNPTTPPSTTTSGTGINILVNGNIQNAGTASTTTNNGQTTTTIAVDQGKLEQKLESEGNKAVVTIPVNTKSDVVVGQLNGQMIKNMETKEAVLEIKTENVTYTLPASEINIDDVSSQIGKQVELKDIKVDVKVAEPSADTAKIVQDTANKNNYQVVVKPVEFEITCTNQGKTVEVSRFNGYVERMVAIPDGVDPSKITTGIVLNADGTFSHVPTQIVVTGGKYYAKINSLTNSTYSVIWNPVKFKDVSNHWAKDDVNDMGSRLIVRGTGNDKYEPDRDITRAEYAAIVVRALGLKPGMGSNPFKDVEASTWYCDYVKTANQYGLIAGCADGSFKPNDKITREQAMIIIARAMKVTKLKSELKDEDISKLLANYSDAGKSADYAKNSIAACVDKGIVSGRSADTIAPKSCITRAEVASIVKRLLKKSDLI
ncbi:MAG: S-layer homology domain-containing protein, partial [Deltaproteobacteria bacterium]